MKRCPRCGEVKHLKEFGTRTSGKPQHWCKICHCQYQREYFERRQSYYAELQAQRVARNRELLRKAKRVPCTDCGQSFPPYVMDFDHRPGEEKAFALANAAGWTRISLKRLEEEVAKCDVVCANCHRIRTHQRRKEAVK
jgi:hypothetical protein